MCGKELERTRIVNAICFTCKMKKNNENAKRINRLKKYGTQKQDSRSTSK